MRGKPGSLSERNQQNNKLYQINKVSIGQVGITPSPLKQTAVQTAGVDRAHSRFHLFLSEWSNECLKCKHWNSGSVTPNMARWHNGYVSWRKQKNSEIKSCLTSLPLCCPKELPVTCLLLKGERWHREPRRSCQMAPAEPPPHHHPQMVPFILPGFETTAPSSPNLSTEKPFSLLSDPLLLKVLMLH